MFSLSDVDTWAIVQELQYRKGVNVVDLSEDWSMALFVEGPAHIITVNGMPAEQVSTLGLSELATCELVEELEMRVDTGLTVADPYEKKGFTASGRATVLIVID